MNKYQVCLYLVACPNIYLHIYLQAVCSLCVSNAFVESSVDAGVLNALLIPIKTWLGKFGILI